IYFHGGGWVLGDVDVADPAVRDIAAASEMICISVDYRRAPEHPFPAALDDCLAVVVGVLAGETTLGIDPKRVAIGGDSAGGNRPGTTRADCASSTCLSGHGFIKLGYLVASEIRGWLLPDASASGILL